MTELVRHGVLDRFKSGSLIGVNLNNSALGLGRVKTFSRESDFRAMCRGVSGSDRLD